MNLLSAAERLAAIDRSSVKFEAGRCLYSLDKFSTCEACFSVCPVNAIHPGKPPILDIEGCVNCLGCLPACPAGAFGADDAVPALLTCATRAEAGPVEIICGQHTVQSGLPGSAGVIRLRGCLAGLGAGAYLALAALGIERVVVRVEGCDQCPWAVLRPHIAVQTSAAQRLLERLGKLEFLDCLTSPEGLVEREIWDADNPPLSRRDLFRMASRQGQVAIARSMAIEPHAAERKPSRDRQRMLRSLAHLPALVSAEGTLDGMQFANLSISDQCTACGVCARACPTGAIRFAADSEASQYQLSFSARDCIGCEICVHVCGQEAVQVDHQPLYEQVFGQPEPAILQAGNLTRCTRCSGMFAARSNERICPSCEYRRKNPFGYKMPPGFNL